MSQEIYKSSCWTCLKAQQDPTDKYICPKLEQHWVEYRKYDDKLI